MSHSKKTIPSSLVIFDLDGTLSHTNVSFAFSKFLYHKKNLSLSKMLKLLGIYGAYTCGLCSLEYVHNFAFKSILKGKSVNDIKHYITLFLDEHLPTLFRPCMLECLQKRKQENAIIWLLSSSPDCIVEPIAAHLGIQTVLATSYNILDGKYESLATIITGHKKRAFLDSFLTEKTVYSIAYSDSIHDLSLLQGVDEPIVVCPDLKLKRIAQANGWQIWQDEKS